MKVRAKLKKGVTELKLLAEHLMETGQRKNSKGKIIPGHYITELTATHKGKVILTAYLGPAVSKDPYLKFNFKGAEPNDTVTLKWVDNQNKSVSKDVVIK